MRCINPSLLLAPLTALGITAVTFAIGSIAAAQTPAYKVVGQDAALATTTNVPVWTGRSTAIDFSQTGEIITYIGIADPSRAVYNTDADITTNQARTVFIRVIEPLRFSGATTTLITNLSIKTRAPDGEIQLYTFNLVPSHGTPTSNGISIAPIAPGVEPTLVIGSNQVATLSDIERGLEEAIALRYTAPNDPVVFKVREFLALARNTTTIPKAAKQAGVSLSVITSLGQLGRSLFHLVTPTSPQKSPTHPNSLGVN